MKEFEAWWKLNWWGSVKEERKNITEASWKAALEWIQSRLKFGSDIAYSEADILMAIKKEIREELEK